MSRSNRLVLVEREDIASLIEGVDFGGPCYCIARSPDAVLIWIGGHSWSVNGFKRYSGPHLTVLHSRRYPGNLKYRTVHNGGRLSAAVLQSAWPRFLHWFGEESVVYAGLQTAIRVPRHTLLIDGGGPRLMPCRQRGDEAYRRWRELPEDERGFRVKVGKIVHRQGAEK